MRTDDGYIINKCLNEEPAAFGMLVDKYKASIYALAYAKLGNFHDAEDVTQEVFLKAYQKLRTLKRRDNFFAWIYSITSNLCKMWWRARANRPDAEFIADQEATSLAHPSMNSHRDKQVRESLHEALHTLPEMYRQVLVLYYLGGMSTKEIAQFLGARPDTVRQRLKRARAQLKTEMHPVMRTTFDQKQLMPVFTFRVVEMVKHTNASPIPHLPRLHWELSVATGIVLTLLSFTPHLIPLFPIGTGSVMSGGPSVVDVGEIQTFVPPVKKARVDRRQSQIRARLKPILTSQSLIRGVPSKTGASGLTVLVANPHQSLPLTNPGVNTASPVEDLTPSPVATAAEVGFKLQHPAVLPQQRSSRHSDSSVGLFTRRFRALNRGNAQLDTIAPMLASTGAIDSADLSGTRFRFGFTKEESSDARSITLNPDGQLLAGADRGDIKLWSVFEQREIGILKENSSAFAFSPDGQLVAGGSEDLTITLWSVAKQQRITILKGDDPGTMQDLAFSPDGQLLASASYIITETARIGKKIGRSASIAIKLWSTNDQTEIANLTGHKGIVYAVAFSPDGQLLASGSWDGTIKLWSIPEGKEIATLKGHKEAVRSVAFSPDGGLLASGSWDTTIKLWSVAEGKEITTLKGHRERIWSVAFSPDGRLLASGSSNRAIKTIKLWSVAERKEVTSLNRPDHMQSVDFSPDGQLLARAAGNIKLWKLQEPSH